MADVKRFTRKEVAARTNPKDTVFIIDNKVYNVSAFLDEHPGGHEVLMNVAGKDASEDFDDIGHSVDAKQLMKKYIVGELVDEDIVERKSRHISWDDAKNEQGSTFLSSWKFPLVVGVLMTVLYSYLFS